MLKAHEDLLAQIELAEEAARELHAKGPRIEDTVQLLRRAGKTIKERIAHYKREAKLAESSPSPRPSPPGEGGAAPQRQQQRRPELPEGTGS